MKRLAILGSGDLGQQIAYHAKTDGHYVPVGFFDDSQATGTIRHDLPILGGVENILNIFNSNFFDVLMIGVGYKHMQKRNELFERFIDTIPFGSIIHSSSYIDPSCKIGSGVFIYPGCTLDMGVTVEDNVLMNTGCVVAHHTRIGKSSFLSPAVKIAGFVTLGECVNLGIGTVVIDNITINNKIRTGAGAVVINHLDQPGLYVGLPAKFKKE